MRWRYILNIIGILIFFFGLTMMVPLLVGLYYLILFSKVARLR
jgi:hypothetical protein